MSRTRRASAACVLGAALGLAPMAPALAGAGDAVTVTAVHNGPASASPRPGVVFTLGRVAGIDPATAEGRKRYADLQAALPTSRPAVVDVVWLPATDARGAARLGDLADGVYLLHEQGVQDASGQLVPDPEAYGDVLVCLPMSDGSGNRASQVDVMPKPAPRAPDLPLPNGPSTPAPSTSTSGTPAPDSTTSATPGPDAGTPTPPGSVPTTRPTAPGATAPAPTAPAPGVTVPTQTTRINSGGGSEFDGATQWATIVAGVTMVPAVFLGTRRRKKDED